MEVTSRVYNYRSIKLDIQGVRERTQRSDKAFTLSVLNTFISLVLRAFISRVSPLLISSIPSGMYAHVLYTLYYYAPHTLKGLLET